ncbi:MAG: C40 family peptidase [Rhodoferax sp.]|jgi:cell wall-associated NlpC family hydrolase|nr:C40 family peptidase [Rhodoferax sp.]
MDVVGLAWPDLGSRHHDGWRASVKRAIGAGLLLLLAGCGTLPAPNAPVWHGADNRSRISPEQAIDVTLYALGLVGTPYRYGGNTPESGFDCSGLIGHIYQTRAAIGPPRTVSLLQDWGQSVSADQLRSGDLVIFHQNGVATHAGIFVGAGRFVHAPSTGGKVRLDALNSKHWAAQRMAFRRP